VKPLRSKANRAQISRVQTLPAPTKGWYVGANLADAPVGTCFILDNAFCELDFVRARLGCTAWATGMPAGAVSSLMHWTNGVAERLFAVRGGAIYDVSSVGAVGAAVVTGLTNDYFESVQFTGPGGTSLIAVNGADAVQTWNGTAWNATTAITGNTYPLASVWTFKSRLYFTETGTMNAWYLGVGAIGGALTSLPLSNIFRWGGALLCGGTWAIDSTSGIYEACVFVSTEGEVAVYNGDYPGATNWTLVGTYKLSKPLGKRCLMKAGGDLAVMTQDGIVPMSKVETLDQVALQNSAITLPIAPAWKSAVQARIGLPGWQLMIWPLASMAIVNLPKADTSDRTQFVSNARTGAWSRFTGWDANCFAVFQDSLFFGTSDGRVMQAEVGGLDDAAAYTMTVFPSYSDCGAPGRRKQLKMVRPMVQSNFLSPLAITVCFDFNSAAPAPPSTSVSTIPNAAKWDVAKWDVDAWPPSINAQEVWLAAVGMGYVISPVVQLTIGQTGAPDVRLTTTDVLFEVGNTLG